MRRNLSKVLNKSYSADQLTLIHRVGEEAALLGFPLYIVGGIVRDLLLNRTGYDFDLVVEGDATSLARVLEEKYGGKVTIHSKFGTAKWDLRQSRIDNRGASSKFTPQLLIPTFLDLISARSEFYKHPASLPTVTMGKIEDDLRRRDFTINTLAIRVDSPHFGELRDDFGGIDDVQHGVVRVLHPRSFIDDPTRMYRAARYEQRLDFKIEHETMTLIPEARSLVDKLSAQRIRHELDLILDEPNPASILERLAKLDLLKPIHVVLPWDESIKARLQARKRIKGLNQASHDVLDDRHDIRLMGWLLWLLALSEKQIESLNKRLHFTAPYMKALLSASRLFADPGKLNEWKPSKCVEYLDEFSLPAIHAVYLAEPNGNLKFPLEKYINEWRHIKPRITGHDLKRLGLQPGPGYHTILRELRNAWLDLEVQDEKEEQIYLEGVLRKLQDLRG